MAKFIGTVLGLMVLLLMAGAVLWAVLAVWAAIIGQLSGA